MSYDRYIIETPENIAFSYEIAGIGSRFMAAIIDTVLILLFQAIIFLVVNLAISQFEIAASVLSAGAGILSFVMLWGYYLLFELIWNGQSPGKRATGLRVVGIGGRPIGFVSSALRNVIRLIDFLPFFYGVGVIVMFIDARARRLGDLAASTLVVRERGKVTLESLTTQATSIDDQRMLIEHLERLTTKDYELLNSYLEQRRSLGADTRKRLAAQLSEGLGQRLNVEAVYELDVFLEHVAEDYRTYLNRNQQSAEAEQIATTSDIPPIP